MRLLRSWPDRIPEGRNYVVDDIERLVIERHTYSSLRGFDDDVLLLEWDIAVGQEDLLRFAERAQATPDRVLVAPYLIYADTYGLPENVWAHRWWGGQGAGRVTPTGARMIETGTPTCNLFGLGMIYLPRSVLARFPEGYPPAHFGDVEMSMWHYQHVAREVPIMWDVRPVHLNYLTPKI
jgi:hypothetical protein